MSCAAGCRSITFRYLNFGMTYEAAVWLSNSAGWSTAAASNAILLTNTCPVGLCLSVDSTQGIEAANRQAQGILHSVYSNAGENARLQQLGATMWRSSYYGSLSGSPSWSTVEADQSPTIFVLSDKWYTDTNGALRTPWSDWNAYRNWVVTSVRQMQSLGINPDYWEVYNEPDHMTLVYYPLSVASTVTPDNLLMQFLVTYQAIRSVIPGAKIIGPSLSVWQENPTSTSFSMEQFMDYASANNLTLAALSWHFNTGQPQVIEDQVAEARATLAAHPALGQPKIFINEFATEMNQRIPGWDVQYLAALTKAKVDSAGRSCWELDCYAPVLDGLLATDGTSTLPDYWARIAYAQMTGTMVATDASSDNAAALASINSTRSQVNVLLGYGHGCTQDPRCLTLTPLALPTGPLTTQLTVKVPWASGQVVVTGSRISGSSMLPIAAPSSTNLGTFTVHSNGTSSTVTINIGSTGDGDAWSILLTHRTSPAWSPHAWRLAGGPGAWTH